MEKHNVEEKYISQHKNILDVLLHNLFYSLDQSYRSLTTKY